MKKEKFIYEKNNAFAVIVKWTPQDGGKQKQKQIGTFSAKKYGTKSAALKAAKAARDKALVDIELNRVAESIHTVGSLFKESLTLLVHNIKTRERHTQTYNSLMPEEMKKKRIEKVTAADIQGTINEFAKTHSADSLPRALMIWKQIYRTAAMKELPVSDRTQAVTLPKSQVPVKKREKFVSYHDLGIFLETLLTYGMGDGNAKHHNLDFYMMIQIMMYCGIRPQEVFALSRDDIDLETLIIHIRHSVGSTDTEKRKIVSTKTTAAVRDVPIPQELVELLADFVKGKPGLLFLDVDGLPYEIDYVSNYLMRVSKKAKVKVTLYMLRHMFATDLSRAVDPKTLQTLMGHETPVMSLSYAKLASEEECRAAIEKRKFS